METDGNTMNLVPKRHGIYLEYDKNTEVDFRFNFGSNYIVVISSAIQCAAHSRRKLLFLLRATMKKK